MSIRKSEEEKLANLAEVPAGNAGYETYIVTKNKLEEDIKDAKSETAVYKKEYWSLFKRLLAPNLVPDWLAVIKKECQLEGYVAKDGVGKTGACRMKSTSMKWCIRTWLRKVFPANSAERQQQYLQGQITWVLKVPIGVFCNQIQEISAYLGYLPCLKDKEGAPADMPRANKPLSDIETCQVILLALPYSLQAAYYAHKGVRHFTTDILTLKEDLQLIQPNFAITTKLVAQVRTHIKQSKPVKPSAKKATEIWKARNGNKKPEGKSKKGGKSSKLCQRCAM